MTPMIVRKEVLAPTRALAITEELPTPGSPVVPSTTSMTRSFAALAALAKIGATAMTKASAKTGPSPGIEAPPVTLAVFSLHNAAKSGPGRYRRTL